MNVVACYPRSMSAWLSNFITVPHQSLYAHDVSMFPEIVDTIQSLNYPYKGFVDTALTVKTLPNCHLTVIDNDVDKVKRKTRKSFGDSSGIPFCERQMEQLKEHGTVVHMDEMDGWIEWFFTLHTGLPMDWKRYELLKNINMQSQLAMKMTEE